MGKVYFASDFHLGAPNSQASKAREERIVRWLDEIRVDAEALYLVGDVFDFWFEYKTVVPKGALRLLGKLAEWRAAGIPVYFFNGNHDIWMFSYLTEELDIPIYSDPVIHEIKGKRFFIGHGDGLGPGDKGYKMLKKVFRNRFCQWLFRWLHPDLGIGLANYFSRKSRQAQHEPERFWGKTEEWLYVYANYKLDTVQADYFVFGHRHLPIDILLKNGTTRYLNLGEWLNFNSYGVFDGETMEIRFFENPKGHTFPQAGDE